MFWNSRKTSLFENILLWDIRRLLFSNIWEYSKTSLFEYSFSFQNVLIDRTTKILLLATKLTTFPNNHEKQAERCIKIHTLVYRRIDEFHNVRARRTLLEGSFLTSCFILSLSLSVCGFCFDLQRSAIKKNGRYLGSFSGSHF